MSPVAPAPRPRCGDRAAALALASLVVLIPGLAGGCRASAPEVAVADTERLPLHWPVPPPPLIRPEAPVLWVALAAHLGPVPGSGAAAAGQAPLVLEAGSGVLRLRDGSGQVQTASRLLLDWRQERLVRPQAWRRRVVGPFPSYESAERVVQRWGAAGLEIAHPGDWEIWAPVAVDRPLPSGLSSRFEQGTVREQWQPRLRRERGRRNLIGPLEIEAPGGLRWQGGLYAGPFRLQIDALGRWTLLETVPLERYLEGVLPHEIGAGAPAQALAAQAVLARTWALRNHGRFRVDGYHLCADTQCQVYGDPMQAGAGVREAIRRTRHQVLAWKGRPIQAVYHASNGGIAAGFEESWGGDPVPYLVAAPDGPAAFAQRFAVPLASASRLSVLLTQGDAAYGSDHPRFRWTRRLQAQRLVVLERGVSGRVLSLAVDSLGSPRLVLQRDAIRRRFPQLPSTLFQLTSEGGGWWRLEGGGFGHGVGLSQAGALDLARRGWSFPRILSHYYPGTVLQPLEALAGDP
ncbi:MAG: SpoIID/LytB domain-containing protein [Cyanobacteriota bacterium]